MKGGKRKRHHKCEDLDDSSSTSESESEKLYEKIKLIREINNPQPIVYWWYAPQLYTSYTQRLPSIYVPTFRPPLLPYVEINLSNLSSAWLG